MLTDVMAALAAAAGTAVVQAAGTDAWGEFKHKLAEWFGRGDHGRERAELERLDHTSAKLDAAESDRAELARAEEEGAWRARVEAFLESLDNDSRDRAAADLGQFLAEDLPRGNAHNTPVLGGAAAAGRDITIRADQHSIAAVSIGGNASVGPPSQPDPSQG
jgi:hypothetical protein